MKNIEFVAIIISIIIALPLGAAPLRSLDHVSDEPIAFSIHSIAAYPSTSIRTQSGWGADLDPIPPGYTYPSSGAYPRWEELYPAQNYPPSNRQNASLTVIESSLGTSLPVLFGGTGCAWFCNETSVFGTINGEMGWIPIHSSGPSAREGAAFANDPVSGGALLYGGRTNSTFFADTWLFSGKTEQWLPLKTRNGPPALAFASMVFDPNLGGDLLFGGETSSGAASGTSWLYIGGNWTRMNTTGGPPARWGAALTFDSTSGQTYLMEGRNGSAVFNDLWVLTNDTWLRVQTSSGPPARYLAASTSTAGGYPLLFGGFGTKGQLNDTWMYEVPNGSWINITALLPAGSPNPAPLGGGQMAPYLADNLFLLVGEGMAGTSQMVTWLLSVPEGGTPGGMLAHIATTNPSGRSPFTDTFTAMVSGGLPPYNYTWTLGIEHSARYGDRVSYTFVGQAEIQEPVSLQVSDSKGDVVSVAITVLLLPPARVSPYNLPTWIYDVGAIAAIIVISFGMASVSKRALRRAHEAEQLWIALGIRAREGHLSALVAAIRSYLNGGTVIVLAVSVLRESENVAKEVWRGIRTFLRRGKVGAVWLFRNLMNVVAKLVFVVTVLFLLIQVQSRISSGGTTPFLGLVSLWWGQLQQFFTGAWIAAPYALNVSGGGVSVPFFEVAASTLELAFFGLLLSVAISYPLGMMSGWLRGGKVDWSTRLYSVVGMYFPTVILSFIAIGGTYLFWVHATGDFLGPFGILPPADWFSNNMGRVPSWVTTAGTTGPTGFPMVDGILHGAWSFEEFVLIRTLFQGALIALVYSSMYLRYLRLSTEDFREQQFIRSAQARGVSDRRLLWSHATRYSLVSYIATFTSTFSVFLLTVATVELVFVDVGVGSAVWQSFLNEDVGSLIPLVYTFVLAVVVVNVVADGLIRLLDPRIQSRDPTR